MYKLTSLILRVLYIFDKNEQTVDVMVWIFSENLQKDALQRSEAPYKIVVQLGDF